MAATVPICHGNHLGWRPLGITLHAKQNRIFRPTYRSDGLDNLLQRCGHIQPCAKVIERFAFVECGLGLVKQALVFKS